MNKLSLPPVPTKEKQKRTIETCALRCGVGGIAFYITCNISQLVAGKIFRISASSGVIASSFGALTVISGSIASVMLTKDIKDSKESVWNYSPIPLLQNMIGKRDDLLAEKVLKASLFGLFAFKALRGNFYSLLPSNVCNLGAFHLPKGSFDASFEYAVMSERSEIKALGGLVGCHSCGIRKGKFIADHQPPIKISKIKNEKRKWVASLFKKIGLDPRRVEVKQAFYPQCEGCSLLQSVAVRKNQPNVFVYHFKSIRDYHFTGVFVAFFWWVFIDNAQALAF